MSDSSPKLRRNFIYEISIDLLISCVYESLFRDFAGLEKDKIQSRTADYSNLSSQLFCFPV